MLNNAPVLTGTSLSAPVNDVAQVGGAGRNVGILGGEEVGGACLWSWLLSEVAQNFLNPHQ